MHSFFLLSYLQSPHILSTVWVCAPVFGSMRFTAFSLQETGSLISGQRPVAHQSADIMLLFKHCHSSEGLHFNFTIITFIVGNELWDKVITCLAFSVF